MEPIHVNELKPISHVIHLRGHCPFNKADEHGTPVKIDNYKLDLVRLFDTEVWKKLNYVNAHENPGKFCSAIYVR